MKLSGYNPRFGSLPTIVVAIAFSLLAGCASDPQKPEGSEAARNKLSQLQADPQLASLAPVALKDAETAVRAAEVPRKDKELSKHLVYMADRKIETARSLAQTRLAEDQRSTLSAQRQTARLDSRTREVDNARMDAKDARLDADQARSESEDLQQQIDELNAKETERGLVVTLGDLLFDTGKSELKGGAPDHLGKLAVFLNKYQDRSIIIEGHTDNIGSESSNMSLSQRRANSVKSYLVSKGVDARRLVATGIGEGSPVASNDTAAGRQQNRRVEVIIENTVASSH